MSRVKRKMSLHRFVFVQKSTDNNWTLGEVLAIPRSLLKLKLKQQCREKQPVVYIHRVTAMPPIYRHRCTLQLTFLHFLFENARFKSLPVEGN